MNALNRMCTIVVEVALLLTGTLALLAPISAWQTRHVVVSQTIDAMHALLSGDVSGLTVGQMVPLYRFNPDWKAPIGMARIERLDANSAEIAIDPQSMQWPLGRQGTLIQGKSGVEATVGSNMGFVAGNGLSIFKGTQRVGYATIIAVSSEDVSLALQGPLQNTDGLVVSEYGYVTQVAYTPPSIALIEGVVIVAVLLVYALYWILKNRSPFLAVGLCMHRFPLPRRLLFWVVNTVCIPPFAYFMAKMPLILVAYAVEIVTPLLGHSLSIRFYTDTAFPYVFILELIACYGFLLWKQQSPILAFWRFLSYKRPSGVKVVSWQRGILLWALHLIVVSAFGLTLIGFFAADIAAAQAIGLRPSSLQAFADFWKYVIWALTVLGCLVGYGYSVVSILWGRFIRNLDFTVTGWLTNGFCYPFLGVVVWQLVPGFTGVDPLFAGGPMEYLALFTGFLLNLLYMLSIWNLGTMFDLMSDKGVRTNLFYSVIRHPNYTLEVSMFFVTELIGLSTGAAWLGISLYFFLYWIRSEREDNFMWYSNPAYEAYQKQTPYKFIPGIY